MPGFSSTSRRPAARAFTLIEIVLVIAILLALGALILPNIAASLADRAFEAASEDIRTQLLLGRAHAQAANLPVEVIYEPPDAARSNKPMIRVRTLEAALRAFEHDETSPFNSRFSGSPELPAGSMRAPASAPTQAASQASRQADRSSALSEPWAQRSLAAEFSITNQSPAIDETSANVRSLNGSDEQVDPAERISAELRALDSNDMAAPHSIRLAVFMADGSALLGGPVWLVDAEGRMARIHINTWTGLPEIERLPDRNAITPVSSTTASSTHRSSTRP